MLNQDDRTEFVNPFDTLNDEGDIISDLKGPLKNLYQQEIIIPPKCKDSIEDKINFTTDFLVNGFKLFLLTIGIICGTTTVSILFLLFVKLTSKFIDLVF